MLPVEITKTQHWQYLCFAAADSGNGAHLSSTPWIFP